MSDEADFTDEELVAYKEFASSIIEHMLEQDDGCHDVDEATRVLNEYWHGGLEDSIQTLECSHCGDVVPGIYWTELDMDWRCPNCGIRHSENDGVNR